MSELLCYGVIFAAQAFVTWLYCAYIFPLRLSTAYAVLAYAGGYLTLCFIRLADAATPVVLAAFALVNLLLLPVCFHCSVAEAVLHAGLLTGIMVLAEGLAALLLAPFDGYFTAYDTSLLARTASAVLGMPVYFWAAMVASRFFKTDPAEEDMGAVSLLSLLPMATEVACVAFIYVGCAAPLVPAAEWMMVISMLSLLLLDILVLAVYNNIQKNAREATVQQLAAQKDMDDLRLYQALQQQYNSQRIFIHDIRRHTQMVETMLLEGRQDQAVEYMRGLNAHPAIQNDKVFCRNGTLNIILAQHHSRCRAAGVQLHTDIRESCIDGMDAVSITALFGNLLTNACEAAERSAQKYIEFSITPQRTGGALITVENSCDRPPEVDEKGFFITQKRDKAAHGIGISSIAQVVHKYGGTLKMYYDPAERAVHTVIGIKK